MAEVTLTRADLDGLIAQYEIEALRFGGRARARLVHWRAQSPGLVMVTEGDLSTLIKHYDALASAAYRRLRRAGDHADARAQLTAGRNRRGHWLRVLASAFG
jgi:hypothetical protein